MAQHTAQTVVEGGLNPAFAAVTASETVLGNDGDLFLWIKNAGAGATNVSQTAIGPCNAGVTHNIGPVAVPAGSERLIRLGKPERVGFDVTVTFSVATSVTMAVIRLAA